MGAENAPSRLIYRERQKFDEGERRKSALKKDCYVNNINVVRLIIFLFIGCTFTCTYIMNTKCRMQSV